MGYRLATVNFAWPKPHTLSSLLVGSVFIMIVALVMITTTSLRRSSAITRTSSNYARAALTGTAWNETCAQATDPKESLDDSVTTTSPNDSEPSSTDCETSEDELITPATAASRPDLLSPVSVLIVCMGNICRSPLAEAVLVHEAKRLGLPVTVDSAGAGPLLPYFRPLGFCQFTIQGILALCHQNGIPIQANRRSRQVTRSDFHNFDYILATDGESLAGIASVAPTRYRAKVLLFGSFADGKPVSDPYWLRDAAGLQQCLASIRAYSHSFLKTLYGDGIFAHADQYHPDPDRPDTLPPWPVVMLRSVGLRIRNAVVQMRAAAKAGTPKGMK